MRDKDGRGRDEDLQIASRLCYKAAMSTGGAPIMASARYELRKTASGWTVWDTAKGTPAVVKGVFGKLILN